MAVASRDDKEYVIETILQHRGDMRRKRTLEFLIKWAGYDESYNSWEPWSAIRATDQLHQYLIHIGQPMEIPIEFRENYSSDLFLKRKWKRE